MPKKKDLNNEFLCDTEAKKRGRLFIVITIKNSRNKREMTIAKRSGRQIYPSQNKAKTDQVLTILLAA